MPSTIEPRHDYVVEEFTSDELTILGNFFTNPDLPVYAIMNLPEVVRGALFARYSRSDKSLRRLFLDEFAGDLGVAEMEAAPPGIGLKRAEDLYAKIFLGFGDDSVAQLAGAHLVCDQASNLLTKILEWGRLGNYLEQSTRYIPFDTMLGGKYRYYRDPAIMKYPELAEDYVAVLNDVFETYGHLIGELLPYFEGLVPHKDGESDRAHRAAARAKVLDCLRGLLPAATLSNLGIFASGQAFENMLVRMNSLLLPEAHNYAAMMLQELRKVIPSFLARVDLPDRGGARSAYLLDCREQAAAFTAELMESIEVEPTQEVTLLDFDPDAEVKLCAAIMAELDPFGHGEAQLRRRAEAMSGNDRFVLMSRYFGDRSGNRRHRPGRALETVGYRFEVLSDYGSFRDLQRHRMLTLTWQSLTPNHEYSVPAPVVAAGSQFEDEYRRILDLEASLYYRLADHFPLNAQPQYAVGFAFPVRYHLTFNAREAVHMFELRTGPDGHDDYRRICQEMHRQVREVAGHEVIALMMQHVDNNRYDLGRLEAERRLEAKRAQQQG